ncbi:hypothetical protein NIES267_11750 [Calothrix parasitica NIES-267]|uniref:Uncharacterized protein n=1 Tax=Calothrix parasitica NIES-267 TaxID=1973488 RepID=A0A1Z4LKS2_9CYAN|nr:hypothetical protein NIES267_11750 [Calothrix parasitica NIES-267]
MEGREKISRANELSAKFIDKLFQLSYILMNQNMLITALRT